MILTQEQREYFKRCPAIFLGQSETRLVLGKQKFKVRNMCSPTTEYPSAHRFCLDNGDFKLTPLEEMYRDFCDKVYGYLVTHSTLNGEFHPHKILFPDFIYEVVSKQLPIE